MPGIVRPAPRPVKALVPPAEPRASPRRLTQPATPATLRRKREDTKLKAPPFAYLRAETQDHLFALLAEHGDDARILAGGQSLLASLNLRLSEPRLLVDITHLPGLSGISLDDGTLTIGALTTHAAIDRSPLVALHAPLLARAVRHVAHPAIRNRGTIGGSLALNDPAAEYPACMVALRAILRVRGPAGPRRIPAKDFVQGVYATALGPGEMLEAVEIPAIKPDERSVFLELARRHGDYAMVGLALHGRRASPACVFFAVADGPVPAPAAMAALPHGIAAAQAALAQDLRPAGDLNAAPATRLHLARVLLGRALTEFLA